MNPRSMTQFTGQPFIPEEEVFDPSQYKKPGLTENDIIQIKEVFDEFDFDKDGFLNPLDIRTALTKNNYSAMKETVFHIIAEYDQGEEGALNFNDFLDMCSQNHNQKKENIIEIKGIYRKYDKNKKGYFDIDDLKRVSRELGEDVENEVLEEMIKSIDKNMDGRVTYEDFVNAMTKPIA